MSNIPKMGQLPTPVQVSTCFFLVVQSPDHFWCVIRWGRWASTFRQRSAETETLLNFCFGSPGYPWVLQVLFCLVKEKHKKTVRDMIWTMIGLIRYDCSDIRQDCCKDAALYWRSKIPMLWHLLIASWTIHHMQSFGVFVKMGGVPLYHPL